MTSVIANNTFYRLSLIWIRSSESMLETICSVIWTIYDSNVLATELNQVYRSDAYFFIIFTQTKTCLNIIKHIFPKVLRYLFHT